MTIYDAEHNAITRITYSKDLTERETPAAYAQRRANETGNTCDECGKDLP